jgi:two-component system sensor histidine kinase/response regulator
VTDDKDPYKERLELALEAAGLDLWETNIVDGTMAKAVTKTLADLGYDESEYSALIDDMLQKLSHPDDVPRIYAAVQDHVEGRTPQYRCEFRLLSKAGAWIWFANYGKIMDREADQPGSRFIGVTFNINDRKHREDEMAAINQQLEAQIVERQAREAALHEANLRAEAASQAKSHFLSNMSHEIRTPMNAIIGLSDLALKTALSAQQHDYLAKIHNAGTSLLGIVNDILDLSKIEAGKLGLNRSEFMLDRALERVAAVVAQKASDKELELVFDIPDEIPQCLVGDALRVEQVLTNLIGNAIKFTDRGEVVVRAERLARNGNHVTLKFAVRDTGIGITAEQQRRLFTAFTQADDSITRKYGGTGLGLAITKRLVEMMGGSIWVDSEPEVGSTFSFSLGFGVGRATTRSALPGRIEGLRVLVVDDNPQARRVLSGHCAALPLEVDEAESGAAALAAVRAADQAGRPYGLVLMDGLMPNMGGIEVARIIKNDAQLSAQPLLVLVSAFGRDDLFAPADTALLDAFLTKPVGASTLVDTLMELYGGDPKAVPSATRCPYWLDGLRVLLVEDNAINQQVATELMSGAGMDVTTAANGRIALETVQAGQRFDLVLMDLQMPEMDGFAATAALRADPALQALPIVAMTAHAMQPERARCLAAGMNDHLPKPIDPELLFYTVARWTGRSGENAVAPPAAPLGAGLLDAEAATRRLGLAPATYRAMLAKFVQAHGAVGARIAAALAAGTREDAARHAHTIKGVAATLGAYTLADVARDLEQAIEQGREDAALLARFERSCAATLEAIGKLGQAA